MPFPGMLFGGLAKGFAGGAEKQQELQLKKEEAGLRSKMLDAQIKHMDAQQRVEDQKQVNLQNLMTGRKTAQDLYQQSLGAGTAAQPMVESPGDTPFGNQVAGQPGAATGVGAGGRAMTPQESLIHTAIGDYSHALPAEVFKKQEDTSFEGQLASLMKQQALIAAMNRPQGATAPAAPTSPLTMPGGQTTQVAPGPMTAETPQAAPSPAAPPPANPYRVVFDAKGKPKLAPATNPREPLDIPNKTYFDQRAAGKTHEEALTAAAAARKQLNVAGGEGTKQGGLNVTQTPEYKQNVTDIATARTAGTAIPESADTAITSMRTVLQQLDRIDPNNPKSLYKDAYVGPIAGRQGALRETFGETPIIGAAVGGPIEPEQAEFRQAVNGIFNELANLRGGKVLPEQELKRIETEAASLTQSPQAFKSKYKGFRRMLEGMLANRISNVATTRSQVGNIGPAGPAQGKAPAKILSIEPLGP